MRKYRLMASAAPLIVALATGQAHAQAAAQGAPAATPADDHVLQTIVVTAQKRAENIQSVPLSIQAVTGQSLQAAGVTDPVGLEKLVPSLQVNNTLFGAGVTIRIRGFGSAANSGTDSDVASYLDGAFIARPGSIMGSFLDVKNVEVLNGPQGTLFGRNAAMGAISISTNAPTHRQSLDLIADGGSYGTYSLTGVGNTPVTDNFALRAAFKASHTDGIYHNNLDGKTYGESDGLVGRISGKWDISSNLSWTVRLDGTTTNGDGAYPEAVYTKTATTAQLTALNNFIGRFGGSPLVDSSTPSYNFNQVFSAPFEHDHQYGVTSDIDWNLSSILTMRLMDSYRDWHNNELAGDTIGTSLNLLSVLQTTSSKSQSHELQLISSKDAFLGGKLGFTAGLYYFQEDFNLNTGFNLGSQFCTFLASLAPPLATPCRNNPQTGAGVAYFNQSTNSYAAYAQANYQILPTVELDVGVRETKDDKSGTFLGVTPNPLAIGQIEKAEPTEALSASTTKPSVRASLSWHMTDKVMAFATYSTGFKSGGFNSSPTTAVASTPAAAAAIRTFAPETAEDYELGVKSTFWERKALLNVSLFDTELQNFQDRSFNGTAFVIRNAGNVRSRGVDINGQVRALDNVTLTYGATYLDSIYTSDHKAPGLEGCTGTPTCPLVQDLSGRALGYAPRWQGDGGVDWKIGSVMGYRTDLVASEHFTTGYLTANTDNPQSRLPGYYTTDLRVNFTSPDSRWELEIYGSNIFDQHYFTSTVAQVLGAPMGINTATGATVFRGFLGDPARFGARLYAKF